MTAPFKTIRITFLFIFLFSIIFFKTKEIYGQESSSESDGRFYITAHTSLFTGTTFPNVFDAYLATGPAAANSYYTRTLNTPSGNFGFGGSVGYQAGGSSFSGSIELEFSMITHADEKETLEEENFNGTNFTRQHFTTVFSQTKRKNSTLLANANLGIFPFESIDLGFYISVGVGYGWQSFHSDATAYAQSRGYNTKTVGQSDWFDIGDYNGNGNFSRASFVYLVGFGSELFVTEKISLKFYYKYIASSYTKENVLISSGAVNVYQDKKSYEYTFANKIAFGISYYFIE